MTAYTPIRMTGQASSQDSPPALIDIPALWATFRRRQKLFFAGLLTTLAVVVLINFQLTPLYTAEARVVINNQQAQAMDVSAILSGISPDAASVETEVQILTSRQMAQTVADQLDLYAEPEFNPALGEEGLIGRLLPGTPEPMDEDVAKRATVSRLMNAIDVERAGITYAIIVEATSQDPELAARIANAYAESYIVDQLDQKFETYERVSTYLADATERNRVRLRDAEGEVEQYRTANGLLSAEGSLLSEQQISDLQSQLIVSEADLSESRAKFLNVSRRIELGAGVEAVSDVLASPVIADLRSKQAALARRRADLETRYGERHPLIDNLASEEADLQRQIDAEMGRIVGRLENDVEVARQRVTSLRSSIGDLRSGLSTDNQAMVRLRELEREAEVSRQNYEALMTRRPQVDMFEDLAEADARIADRAAVPLSPSFPNTKLNLALGLMLGGAVGALLIALVEVFDSGLRTSEDLERVLATRALATVPMLEGNKLRGDTPTPQDYLVAKPLSAFAESYRTLRSAISLSRDAPEGGRVVAVTSAVSGEAKTITALCLGRIAAMSGDRVLIIDCDLRRRILSESMGADDDDGTPGLGELMSGAASVGQVILKDEQTELRVLPVSKDGSAAGDLFGSGRFESLLEKLRTRFDLIVLDTAPLTAVAETRTVCALADQIVQCVKWKGTRVEVARAARKILDGIDTPLLGAVLTQVDTRAQTAYGYEGSKRYYNQAGKYYFD